MIVLGYNGFAQSSRIFASLYNRTGVDRNRVLGHDAAACVFIDGELRYAVEEERLTRVKRTSDFPALAISACLEHLHLKPQDVDLFAFPWRFDAQTIHALENGIYQRKLPAGAERDEIRRLHTLHRQLTDPSVIRHELSEALGLKIKDRQLVFVPHHIAHLMCGYYNSGRGDAAFLVSDGRAEHLSSVAGEIKDGAITTFEDMSVPIKDSLSQLYSKVTRYLGFVPNSDEYKVMGLSAFGKARPLSSNEFFETALVALNPHGTYSISVANDGANGTSSPAYYEQFGRLFGLDAPPQALADKVRIASAVQDVVEKTTSHQIRELESRSNEDRLLIEGGLALNCVNNGRISRFHRFSDVRVSFGASDPGVALGAGYYPTFVSGDAARGGETSATAYLGPAYDAQSIVNELDKFSDRVEYRHLDFDELTDTVVTLLQQALVIGWFQGRTEFGPRALCNRSIIANPAIPGIQDIINSRVKKREMFRPFGPVIRADRAPEVFDMGHVATSPYMTFTYPVRREFEERLRGAVHVDGTSRIQTITPEQNHAMNELLARFERRTGVPALINTSFNIAGEPVVSSPRHAIECFLKTDIDYLVLGSYLVSSSTATNSQHADGVVRQLAVE